MWETSQLCKKKSLHTGMLGHDTIQDIDKLTSDK